jgi:hypothetical protein
MDTHNGYIDLHTHTCVSDGILTPHELVEKAKENNIRILAITDHNRMLPKEEFDALSREAGTDMTIIRASEVSCLYSCNGRNVELHVVALFPDASSDLTDFTALLNRNTGYDRRPYINAMLANLSKLGIDIGTYDDLLAQYHVAYLGRPQVAKALADAGYVSSPDEAMDEYIGDFGKRRAWVANPNKNNYCSIDEVIDAIKKAKGLAILAHLYYYKLNELEAHYLLKYFSEKTGLMGGLETEYRVYSEKQRYKLRHLADIYDLFPSAASDYHGIYQTDGLDNHFPFIIYDNIRRRYKRYYISS